MGHPPRIKIPSVKVKIPPSKVKIPTLSRRARQGWGTRFGMESWLLDGAADLREDVVGVGADQTDRAHDDDEDHGQHDRVFGDVLTFFVGPKPAYPRMA
jgi:hypothetical protein